MDLLAAFGMPRRKGFEQTVWAANRAVAAPPPSMMVEPTPAMPSMPSFAQTRFSPADLADRLPPRARAKLVAFREAKALAHAGLMEVTDRRDAERTLQQTAEQRLLSLRRDYNVDPDGPHQSSVEARAKRDKARVEGARLQQIYDERAAAWQTLARLVENLERWLKGLRPDVKILEHTGPFPPLAKGISPARAVERARSEHERLVAELAAVEAAPIPSAEAKRLARNRVADLAKLGAPDVTTLLRADVFGERSLKFATTTTDIRTIHRAGVGSGEVLDALATMAWLHGDAMIAKLDAEIDAAADDKRALTNEQREARKRELTDAILEVERAEEFAVEAAAAEGTVVPRRENADPRAVLNLTEKLPSPQRD